ncbi:hypothetical protein E2C01_005035 [Portunus trituberculatus]|uniref:CCHC-type domain-containing protein n=1 Tax=Portunus trituberculatus TaxID=210409 RepID=A0A5B7CRA9_PORTR|nr:hypothetical protein [Portunus trituberculatus]
MDSEGRKGKQKKKEGQEMKAGNPAQPPHATTTPSQVSDNTPSNAHAANPSLQHRNNAPRRFPALVLAPRATLPGVAFRISPNRDWSAYEVVETLQDELTLSFSTRPGREGFFIIHPKDEETTAVLSNLTSLHGKPVKLQRLTDPSLKVTKGVVMGFLHGLPLDLLTRQPNMLSAFRCRRGKHVIATRQMEIEHEGLLPGKLDLGIWGVFYIRPFSKEPLRCYNCRAFGHSISQCKNAVRCGICSESHNTQECLEKYKAKQETTSKCPNCQGNRHAWNKSCQACRSRVEKAMEGQARHLCMGKPEDCTGTLASLSPEEFLALQPVASNQTHPVLHHSPRPQAPQHTQPQEPTVTLTASALKNLLSGLIVSIAKIVKDDSGPQALDTAVDSLVARVLQPTADPVPLTHQPTTNTPQTPSTTHTFQQAMASQTSAATQQPAQVQAAVSQAPPTPALTPTPISHSMPTPSTPASETTATSPKTTVSFKIKHKGHKKCKKHKHTKK